MSDISHIEYAVVFNAEGHFQEYCHGTYEEVESYCEQKGWYVDRYLDNVAPSTVQKGFRYAREFFMPQNQNHSRFVNRLIFLRSWYVWDLHLILHLRLKFSLNLLRLLRGEGSLEDWG